MLLLDTLNSLAAFLMPIFLAASSMFNFSPFESPLYLTGLSASFRYGKFYAIMVLNIKVGTMGTAGTWPPNNCSNKIKLLIV